MNTYPHRVFGLTMFFLLTLSLAAQEDDTKRIQLATGGRVGLLINAYNIEPAGSGSRQAFGYFYEQNLEARLSEKWSLFALTGVETIENYRDAEPSAGFLTADPNIVNHPYTSKLKTFSIRLGGQYNYRIGSGDLSVALAGGIAGTTYDRTYDFVARETLNRQRSQSAPGVTTDLSDPTFNWTYGARVQYMHWISRKFAVGAGLQAIGYRYFSGGIDTTQGKRFKIGEQESSTLPARYPINYDTDSLTVDPTNRPVSFQWFITLHSRI